MQPAPVHHRYDILRPIARGGMAMVYLAREVDTGREVALKHLVVPEGARVAEWRLRFQQEFHLAARLHHPSLVATYDYAEPREELPFFTMEFLPGPGLEEAIPMAPERVLAMLPGLLAALSYLHSHGLVHSDLKPENIRYAADGSVRLMDLGLVTRAGQPSPGIQGTLPYLAPEVIRRAPADRRSDLYALGAVLYHLLVGQPPFHGENRNVLMGHLETEPTPIRNLVPTVSPLLAEVIHRLLAKDPVDRFQSAAEALRFLGADADLTDDQTLFRPPLVGRQSELKALHDAFKRTKTEGYQEVWLHGDHDAGLGAILEEFCSRGQLLGAHVLRGVFRPRMAPFEGLRGMLRGLVALLRAQPNELARWQPIVACLDPELGPALDMADMDPAQELLRLQDAIAQLIRLGAATAPLILVFDDTHLADPTFRDLLAYLQRNAHDLPILLVSTFVGEPETEFDPCRSEVPVPPMSPAETDELCRGILGLHELPADFTSQIHALADGRPLRIDQLLRGLVASGRLRRENGLWQFPREPLDTLIDAKDPGWAVVAARKSLPPLAGDLLDLLVVLGREADLVLLRDVAGRLVGGAAASFRGTDEPSDSPHVSAKSEALFESLARLEELGWVAGRDGLYAIADELPLDRLLADMAPERRRHLHAALVETLLTLTEAPADSILLAEIARHALGAGDRNRGPAYALAAAERQTRLFGLEAAESLLREAIALLELPPIADSVALLPFVRLRADVARLAGDRRLAEATYMQALHLAGGIGDAVSEAHVLLGYGRHKLATGDTEAAVSLLKQALERFPPQMPYPAAAEALTQLGRCALTRGDLGEARTWVESALAMAREGGFRSLIRENMAQLGYLYVAGGEERSAEGLGMLFEALQLTEQDEAKIELNACYALLGNALLLLGRYTEAHQAFVRNCDLCAQIGAAPHDEATAYMRRVQVALETGHFGEARQAAKPAGALARMVGNKVLLAQVRLIEGLTALYQGDFTIWQDAAGWVEETLTSVQSDNLAAMWHVYRAEAEAHLARWASAMSAATAALQVIERGAGHEFLERAQIIKAEGYTAQGFYKPARIALEAVQRPRNEAQQARLLLAFATLDHLEGQPGAAQATALRAMTLARRSGVLPLEAQCCLLLARLTHDADERARLTRHALLQAELCGHPTLEAEALRALANQSARPEQQAWFLQAAEEAWNRAVAQLPPSLIEGFTGTEERRTLRDLLKRRASDGARLQAEDQVRLLGILTEPPTLDRLYAAIAALCHEMGAVKRLAFYWEDASGAPQCVRAEGVPFGGSEGPEELEAAYGAGANAMLFPLTAGSDTSDSPWGALLVVGLPSEAAIRLERMLPTLGGALWAAHQLWLARTEAKI